MLNRDVVIDFLFFFIYKFVQFLIDATPWSAHLIVSNVGVGENKIPPFSLMKKMAIKIPPKRIKKNSSCCVALVFQMFLLILGIPGLFRNGRNEWSAPVRDDGN
jgi:hypothetical protein